MAYDRRTKRRRWHSLGTKRKDIAQRRFARLMQAIEAGEFDPFEQRARDLDLSFEEAAQRYLEARTDLRETTRVDMERFLSLASRLLPAGKPIREMTPEDIRSVIYHPPARATQRGYYRRMSAFLNWCERQGMLSRNPIREISPPAKEKKLPEYLTQEEFGRLMEVMEGQPQLQRIVRMAVSTGMRLGEVLNMEWAWVDMDAERITVQPTRTWQPKTGTRSIPLFPEARRVLEEQEAWLREQFDAVPRVVFVGPSGGPYNRHHISQQFKRFARAAGLPERISFHSLRHTFASWSIMAGVSIYVVSRWLGHSTVSTTEIYAHLAPDYVPEEAGRIFQ